MGIAKLKSSSSKYIALVHGGSRPIPYPQYADDPVGFFKNELGIELTAEQIIVAESVRDRPITNVKAAHGVGKCVAKDEKILLSSGREVSAKFLVGRKFELLTLDNGVVIPVAGVAEWNQVEAVYEITTETGRRIIRSGNHPLWAAIKWSRTGAHPIIDVQEWASIETIQDWATNPPEYTSRFRPKNWSVKDGYKHCLVCAVPKEIPIFGNREIPEHEIKIMAYLIGDGGLTTLTPTFTQQDGKQLDEFRECVEKMGCTLSFTSKYCYRVINPVENRYTKQGKITYGLRELGDFSCDEHISTAKLKKLMQHTDNTLYGRLKALKIKPTSFYGKAYLSKEQLELYQIFDECLKLSALERIKGSVRGNQARALVLLGERYTKVPSSVNLSLLEQQKCNAICQAKLQQGIQAGTKRNGLKKNPVTLMLESYGLMGKDSYEKTIPGAIFELPKKSLAIFLSRLFATDGWACLSKPQGDRLVGSPEIGFCSMSRQLVEQIQRLLLRFGVVAYVSKKAKVNAWVLWIHSSEMIVKFADEIGIYGKEEAVNKVAERARQQKLSKQSQVWRTKNAPDGTIWEEIVSIKKLEDEQLTVAIEVPGYEHYLTNFWEHNSYIAALLVIYFLFCVGGIAITTAPSEDQVKWVLWAELRKIHAKHKQRLGGRCDIMQLLFSESIYAFGFTSKDYSESSFQGKHNSKQLLIQDEADGVTPQIDNGFISCLTGSKNRGLRIGNPVDPQSRFAKSCKLDKHCLTISAFSHPNVAWAYELCADDIHRLKPEIAEKILNEDGEVKPQEEWPPELPRDRIEGAISIDWIEKVRRDFGETSPFWKGRVLGEYAEDATDGIIPLTLLKQARSLYDKNPDYWDKIAMRYPWRLGLDVGDGGDPHALALLRGPVLYEVQIHQTKGDLLDTVRAAEIAAKEISLLGADYSISVDNTGVGAGTLATLKQMGLIAYPCRFGDAPTYKKKKLKEEPEQKFVNYKAELHWNFREVLRKGQFAIAPLQNEEYVFQDLTATRYSTNTKDEIFCEPKEKTKARLGRSSDSEAVIIALNSPLELGGVPQDASTAYSEAANRELEELMKYYK